MTQQPAVLVSNAYLDLYLRGRTVGVGYRNWAMDSGAFTAKSSGKHVDLDAYIETCKELLASDPTLVEVFALDVIGDWQASLRNCEKMWAEGIEAIPCFHVGSPEEALIECARYPKLALGGAVLYSDKQRWAEQCFARVWPKRIHGFGWGSPSLINLLPWHSVDASNWETMAVCFGRWQFLKGVSTRGTVDLQPEIDHYLRIERAAQRRWGPTLEAAFGEGTEFTLRLADGGSGHAAPWRNTKET